MNEINQTPPLILILDINSCFATVLQQAYSKLRGKPVVVAAYATAKGCILSPSIEAKRFGIKTAMPVYEAQQLCPHVIVREPDTGLIRDVHHKIRSLLEEYSPDVVPKSIDEFTVDFTSMGRIRTKSIEALGREIKRRIRTETGDYLSTNIGIAPNRFLAKVASNLHKPDGLDIITHENLLETYRSLYLTDLPGINVRYQVRLNMQGILTPLDFYHASALVLKKQVFKSVVGYQWYLRLRGWEADSIEWKTKSFGQDYALGKKTGDQKELGRLLLKLCEKMGRRLRNHRYQATGIHVGLYYDDHTFWHHGHKTSHNLYTTRELYHAAGSILNQQPEKKVVAKLTVRCFDLQHNSISQPTLFDMEDKGKKVSDALDKVNDRYGEFTITPASMMDMDKTILDRIAFGKAGIAEMPKIEGGFFHPPDSVPPSSEEY